MKVEHHDDQQLLTRIRRSYWRIREFKKREEGPFSSRLFTFEHLDCKEIEGKHWSALRCIKVKVHLTDETYVVTQAMNFGNDDWTLYTIEEETEGCPQESFRGVE